MRPKKLKKAFRMAMYRTGEYKLLEKNILEADKCCDMLKALLENKKNNKEDEEEYEIN
jgi:hypothetical protein